MFDRVRPFLLPLACAISVALAAMPALAQDASGLGDLKLPGLSGYSTGKSAAPLAQAGSGDVTLSAQLTDKGADITRGLVWRVFKPDPGPDGKLPLVASAHGGNATFQLDPGSYLVHAAYGRAGATKRITITKEARHENLVLDAGGLELDAVSADGVELPRGKLRFSIYQGKDAADLAKDALIVPNVQPKTVVRLNAGIYHVVSTYGSVNAVVRSDIRVDAGKLTEATVEHHAAEITLKLVREAGGEAMADTSWSVLNEAGESIKEAVGAYAPMVLAEGNYTIIAKNRDRIYQKDVQVEAGKNGEVELLASDENAIDPDEGAD